MLKKKLKSYQIYLKYQKWKKSFVAFCEYVDNKSILPNNLKPLMSVLNTLIVSTAEFHRIFGVMNIVYNNARNSLEISRVFDFLWIKCVDP